MWEKKILSYRFCRQGFPADIEVRNQKTEICSKKRGDQDSFIISDKIQEELQNIVNDTNILYEIFSFGKDNVNNQKLYIIVNNIPTEPLRMIKNFPVVYI